jgi:hypothetical protein
MKFILKNIIILRYKSKIYIPALIYHELSHLVLILLFRKKLHGIYYYFDKNNFSIKITLKYRKYNFLDILIMIAPAIFLIFLILFSLLYCKILLLYIILNIDIFWISKSDDNNTEYLIRLLYLKSNIQKITEKEYYSSLEKLIKKYKRL